MQLKNPNAKPKLLNSKTPKLYGIGIGPGDPKLLTLRAKEVLDKVDTIFVPKGSEDGSSYARTIIEAVIRGPKSIVELTFPMTRDKNLLKEHWQKAAKAIAKNIKKGKPAAFVTIGDPFIYSTYVYLLKALSQEAPEIEIETIPGITSFNAASARAGFPLLEGKEKMAVIPVSENLEGIEEALQAFDTVVLMKVGAKLRKVISLLKQKGLVKNSVLISRLGHSSEKIIRDITSIRDKELGYLSVILIKKNL